MVEMTLQEHGYYFHIISKMNRFLRITTNALLLGLISSPLACFAQTNSQLPENPNVVSGNAVFNKDGNTLTITQNTDKLITNWSSFNISKNNTVKLIQPKITSTSLNRVKSNDPTYLYGDLIANGKVILINPNGVLFKDGSRVDVGSIIASTLNLKDENFINNKFIFEKNGYAGSIVNDGKLKAFEGGTVALIGQQVINNGTINVPGGTASLISGEKITISLSGNKLINYSVDRGILDSLIENNEAIKVNDGQVILSAKGIKKISNAVVNNKGSIEANGITKKGGKIFLSARNGNITNSGSLASNSKDNKGGNIRLTGDEILVKSNSLISSRGNIEGGIIEIGGSWQNSNKNVYQAKKTIVENNVSINTSAYDFGDGGEIVIWSDIKNKDSRTIVKGNLKSEGGSNSGNGGRIETSGNVININEIKISTNAQNGRTGEWLIDPHDISIKAGGVSGTTATSDDYQIDPSAIVTALGSSNVTVFTGNTGSQSGTISVDENIASSSANDLTLQAASDITINANIVRTGTGGLILETGSNTVNGSGEIQLSGGSNLSTSDNASVSTNIAISGSGDVNIGNSNTSTFSGVISGVGNLNKVGSGTVNLTGDNTYSGTTKVTAGTLNVSGTLGSGSYSGNITNSGTLSFSSSSAQTLSGIISGTGALTQAGSDTLTLSGANTYTGDTTITSGTINVSGSGTLGGSSYSGAIVNSGTLQISSSSSQTLSGVISGSGNLIKSTNSNLTLSGSNTYTGSTTINDGTVLISNDNNLGAAPGSATAGHLTFNGGVLQTTSSLTLNSNRGINLLGQATVSTDNSTSLSYGGIITGSGDFIKHGLGSLTLSGNNTNTGFVGVQQGTLSISSSSNLGAIPSSFDNDKVMIQQGILNVTSSITLDPNIGMTLIGPGSIEVDNSETFTINGVIAGNGSETLTKLGSGSLIMGGTNTYTGSTTINAGTVSISTDSGLGAAPGSATAGHLTLNGGTLQTSSTFTLSANRGIALGANDGTIDVDGSSTLTYGGIMAGSNNFTKTGTGTLILSGTNTYTGSTTINAGTVSISADSGLGAAPGSATAGHLTLNGGTLQTTSSFTLSSNRGIALGANDGAIDVDGSSTLTYGGIMAGSNDFTKIGTGTLTLSGANTYTGDTTISSGTLDVSGTLGGGSYAGNIANSGSLTFSSSSAQTVSGVISGSGGLTQSGSNTLTLSGANTYTGDTTISSGTLDVSGTLGGGSYAGNIANSGSLTFSSSSAQTVSGVISGSGGLTQSGSNTLTLSGANTYTGDTTISSGTLDVSGTLGGGSYAGNIANSGSLTFSSSSAQTVSGVISGSGGLTQSGSNTLTLSGANTYTGDTTISSGTLDVSGTLGGGSYAGNIANSGSLTFSSSSAQTVSGVISGSGGLTQSGSNTLTLSGTNTYTGSTTINAGTVSISADSGLGVAPGSATAGHLTLNGGTLQTTSSFTLSSNRGIALGANDGTINTNSGTTFSYAGIISGAGALTKSGTGTVTLTGTNTYTGGTTINAGTLTGESTNIVSSSSNSSSSNQTAVANNIIKVIKNKFTYSDNPIISNQENFIEAEIIILNGNNLYQSNNVYNQNLTQSKITPLVTNQSFNNLDKRLGEIIKTTKVLLKINEDEIYEFDLEFRKSSLIINGSNQSSIDFASNNKNFVIKSAINEAGKLTGYLKSQIKTIVIDLENNLK